MLMTIKTELPIENQPEKIHYQVVHTTLGRCRIHVPRLGNDSEYAKKLIWLVESISFVTSVRINSVASSMVVNYEASIVSSATVHDKLFDAIQQASVTEIPLGAIHTKTEFSSQLQWDRVGLPVLTLGVALLAEIIALPVPALVIGGAIAVAAVPFLTRVIDTLVNEQQLDADILDAIWISLNTVNGDFIAPALMLSLIESGKALRDTTARTAERQALDLLNDLNQYARVERDGQEWHIPLKQVHIGDKVIVYPGDIIPVTGRVLRGTALIDEHILTGESTLICRCEGQIVHASTLVLEGKLCILVKRTVDNTRVGLANQMLQAAPVYDTRVENYASKVANTAIVPTLCLSASIFALTGDTNRALAPLQLDFSNGVGIAVPTTILAALQYAAHNGVYIRSGRALEVLARADTFVFDKTGTLTQGKVAIVAIQALEARSCSNEVLSLAASVEQENTHPVAEAIVRYAKENGIETRKCETFSYQIGMGIVAQINGQEILVGSSRLMEQEAVDLDPIHRRYPDINSSSHSLVYVAQNGYVIGVILYTDPIRPEIKSAIATLDNWGINTYMLTGDRQQVADDVACKLGIKKSNTYGSVLPKKKIEVVCGLRNNGRTVAFVGEGINDAAALAYADVAISFAGGCEMAQETADVILLDDNLSSLTHAIDIAKQAINIVYTNTAIAVIPNIGVVLAGIIFALDPIVEVIISNSSALIAELNSFRPLFLDSDFGETDGDTTQRY